MISQQQPQKLEDLVLKENNCPTVILKSKKVHYNNCQRKIMGEFATSKPLLKEILKEGTLHRRKCEI